MKINHSDVNNVRVAASEKFTATATVEAIWVHGTDPLAPTFFVMVNKNDGTGTPYGIATATYASYGQNTTPGTITYPAGMNFTVGGTSYATTTAAMTAMVALEAAATP